jgi:hypothetical protein
MMFGVPPAVSSGRVLRLCPFTKLVIEAGIISYAVPFGPNHCQNPRLDCIDCNWLGIFNPEDYPNDSLDAGETNFGSFQSQCMVSVPE